MRVVTASLLVLFAACQVFGQSAVCSGEERWSVKTLADPAAAGIIKTPTETTVANMVALMRPPNVNGTLPRSGTTESTEYKISATLTLYKQEADRDYHLVLEDDNDHTMIAEIPDPACVAKDSPALELITKARQEFDSHFRVSSDKHATKIPVTVTGIGFFDIVHGGSGQIGHAENNIELHPVLDIQFNGPAAPDFQEPTTTTVNCPPAGDLRNGAYAPSIGLLWWIIAIVMTIFYIVAIRGTVGTLRRSNHWSLAEALQDTDQKPSSSRMIAFLGLLILMVLYMGIGYVAIWRLLNNEALPNVNTFLLTGLSLFAPYAFNQLKAFATGLTGGPSDRAPSAGNQRGPSAPKSAPKVVGVAPSSITANASTQITVTGSGFDPRAVISVTTNAAPVTPSSALVTATQIQFAVTMPPSSAPYIAVVHVLNPDGGEATGSFQVS